MCQPGKPTPQGLSHCRMCSRPGLLPQSEIRRVALLVAHGLAAAGLLLLQHAVGELAVAIVGVDVEVDVARDGVGVAAADELLDHGDLFRDVRTGPRRNVRPDNAQRVHVRKVTARVGLYDLHGAGLYLTRLAQNTILAAVQQMAHVSQILDVEHVMLAVTQPANHHVEGDVGAGVADMRVVVDGGATDVHVDLALGQRFKGLFAAAEHVEQLQCHGALSPHLVNQGPF